MRFRGLQSSEPKDFLISEVDEVQSPKMYETQSGFRDFRGSGFGSIRDSGFRYNVQSIPGSRGLRDLHTQGSGAY